MPPTSKKPLGQPLFAWGRGRRRSSAEAPQLATVGLFAGIGGLELGLHRAGHEVRQFCEIEPTARAVLEARFPGVPIHDDVTTLAALPAGTDLLAGGFPCQDLSQAGKTAGIAGARSGLVGHVFRLLEQQPVKWVLLENVPFMLQLSKGRAMEVVVAAIEALGYRWAYRVVNSRAFGLPQRRERVYFLASRTEDPRAVLFADDAGEPEGDNRQRRVAFGFYWTEGVRGLGWAVDAVPTLKGGSTIGIPSPPAILMPDGEIVKPDIRDAERMQGFEPGWTSPAETVGKRGGRWKLVGNAVTVDVAEWIGYRLRNQVEYRALGEAPLRRAGSWPRAAWGDESGRFVAEVSAWPVQRESQPLHEFLRHPVTPLSVKATAGFLARTEGSSLRFPEGFLPAVRSHLERMQARAS